MPVKRKEKGIVDVEKNNLESENIKDEEVEIPEAKTKKEEAVVETDKDGFVISREDETVKEEAPEYAKIVDKARLDYISASKVNRWLSIGVFILVIALICVIYFVLYQNKYINDTIMVVLLVIVCVCMLLYTFFGKNLLNRKAVKYISLYYNEIIKDTLTSCGAVDIVNEPKGKIDKSLFIDARVYLNIEAVGSRNVSYFSINSNKYMMAEVAGQIKGKKRMESIFVGRFIDSKNELDIPGRILISVKGNSELYRPVDDIEGLSNVGENKKYVIYSNYNHYKDILKKSVIDLIEQFRIDNLLLDLWISIQAGKTSIGLDLGNELMDLPVDKPFNYANNNRLKEITMLAMKIIDTINNTK